ncbi:FEKKY domain-containing protein [Flavobacterium suncheonense]|uniref:Carboxypeptidase regulatory-like domain-containing protein n=1 Tax=Flavobacterium suncheonense GH29-5 = DSM 17707 TaxID=1121899 RepID=A0A0A2MAB6_9FLAO|nr:hypothetical protein [Flavobacterium suncheonense]KGO85210.1 hypothetical protein Q764_14190 [Flavobacterium suncheonense GH29-5 = DSM 17707]
MRKIVFISFLFINSIYSQDKSNGLSISGNLKVLFGLELTTPKNALIELTPSRKVVDIDSVGNYKFENLKSGIYKIQVIDFNIKPKEFSVELKDESITNFNLLINADCEVNKEIAEIDIQNKKPRLLLIGSIAPIFYSNQGKFEKKYEIKYYDFGCTPPSEECVIQYNKTVFDYLDKKYGRKWRKEVRKDVIGL